MDISEFDYDLPAELIAQHPLARRDAARMLILDRRAGSWRDGHFTEFSSHVGAGDAVAVNNTRVFPARLAGVRENSGGAVELFLVRERAPLEWEALARPARRLREGARVSFGDGRLRAEVIEVLPEGRRVVRFRADESFDDLLEQLGRTPLPPYIKREGGGEASDRERYQTVFAQTRGAIAAPTAGLHFTPQVLEAVRGQGARVVAVTLHVGYGTFEPVRAADLVHHRVAAERYAISDEAAQILNETHERGRRVFAVGTTTTRALEYAADDEGGVRAGAGEADLTITPGYRFRAVDALLTNFHLPRSSLLALVAAFAGHDLTMRAYAHAVSAGYRFYSYGDCMLIT